jgi:hypothetical protein
MALVNMMQSPEEAKEDYVIADPSDAPKYPYGLEIRLDEESLAKLGMTTPPAVGTQMLITAKVTVTSASQYQTQNGEAEASSCWQITDMEVSGSPSNGNAAQSLYGSNS